MKWHCMTQQQMKFTFQLNIKFTDSDIGVSTRCYRIWSATYKFNCKDTGVNKKLKDISTTSNKTIIGMCSTKRTCCWCQYNMKRTFIIRNYWLFRKCNGELHIVITCIHGKRQWSRIHRRLLYGINRGDNDSVFPIESDNRKLKHWIPRLQKKRYRLKTTIYNQGNPQNWYQNYWI